MSTTEAPAAAVLRLRPDRTQRLEALLLGAGPHLEAVLDIGTATNGDLLVELPAPAARLTALLEPEGRLTAGEAVTVLVPLVQALQRLHAAGVAHGGVRAGAVVLDAEGSPAWTAPVAPVLLRRVGPAAFAAQTEADVVAYRALAAGLLAPLGARVPEGAGLDALVPALFDLAEPQPVRLVRPEAAPVLGTPARLLPAAAAEVREPTSGRPAIVDAVLAQVRAVRGRAWLALGGVGALLVAALTLLPGGAAAPALIPAGPSSQPVRPSASSTASASPTPVADRSMSAAAAITALLRARAACIEAGSAACLRRVDAPGSPVLAADLRAIDAGVEPVGVDPAGLRFGGVSGGTALATGAGVSVLAIRDRNDWRLRDVVAEPPVDG